jgi:adenosylmethionine-8-amino-7-oxononanoate aminotransferase
MPLTRRRSASALQHLSDTIEIEGPNTIAAVILETVVGTNGILVPPDGYLAGVRELCDRHGIVMIADEVMSASVAAVSGSPSTIGTSCPT